MVAVWELESVTEAWDFVNLFCFLMNTFIASAFWGQLAFSQQEATPAAQTVPRWCLGKVDSTLPHSFWTWICQKQESIWRKEQSWVRSKKPKVAGGERNSEHFQPSRASASRDLHGSSHFFPRSSPTRVDFRTFENLQALTRPCKPWGFHVWISSGEWDFFFFYRGMCEEKMNSNRHQLKIQDCILKTRCNAR